MRLAPLLAALPDEDLNRLAVEHVRTDEVLPRPQLCNFLEGTLRSFRFVNDFVVNRQPPTFMMLTLLLDAPGYDLPVEGFRERVMEQTRHLAELIDSKEILARDDQLNLYRSALYEARRSDLDLNASEAALLALLRRKSDITQVEHFLIEHHQDLREFWGRDDAFTHEWNALRSAGLLFVVEHRVVLPEDTAPAIWQTLGIDMPTDSVRRLLSHLSNNDLAAALEQAGCRTSGTKEARSERILLERIQPRAILRCVALPTLREICRETEASISGNKDDLIERIVLHFAQGRDQRPDEPVETRQPEARRLDEDQFQTMFSTLHHQELSDILRRFPELRQTGTKEIRITTLWQAHLSEQTLLSELMNRQLEDILHRLGMRLGGSKGERIERIINHFATVSIEESSEPLPLNPIDHREEDAVDPSVLENQNVFRQKSSSPQAALQPWLEQLLDGKGAIRCYATEDANPTKQLKNKLSQAAAARGGLLVLMLADESAFIKAHEALVERWMTNDEWPKSISCVALAYPPATPRIEAIIERAHSPWPSRLRQRLFPSAAVSRLAEYSADSKEHRAVICKRCGQSLPSTAKFCSECGTPTT
jgi:hypothetical protein